MSPLSEVWDGPRAKGLSLQQVADLALVNVKFLETMNGDSFFPRPMFRAFLREYSQVVGLNARESMDRL